jgi:hypothetical protein
LARGIVGIQGETFLLPIRKKGHQSSTREMDVDAEFENLSDPISCQAHSVHCCDVTQRELALRLNLDLLSTFTECPLEGTARLWVSKIDHQMSFRDQLLRVGGVAVFLQVAGRGNGKASAGTRHRLLLNASRNEEAVATVSALALMVESPICGSFAQYGIRPPRQSRSLLSPHQ